MINVSEEVQRLHDRIEANVRLLANNYLGNRYVPADEFIRLKEVFYTEAKYRRRDHPDHLRLPRPPQAETSDRGQAVESQLQPLHEAVRRLRWMAGANLPQRGHEWHQGGATSGLGWTLC